MNRISRIYAHRRALKIASQIKEVDVYYAPEPDSADVALRLARHNGASVLFDIHEIFHGARIQRWLKGLPSTLAGAYLKKKISSLCRQCDLVTGVSKAVLDPYCDKHTNYLIVRSCAPSWFANRSPEDVRGVGGHITTFMHGKNSFSRGTGVVLRALQIAGQSTTKLRVVCFKMPTQAELSGENSLFDDRVQELGVQNMVDLRNTIPLHEMPDILQACDVGMISYGRKLGIGSLPNRLFEFMAAGLVIMAPSYAAEIASIVRSEQCGLLLDFEKPESIAEGMLYLNSNSQECRAMGKRSREAFEKRHNWEIEINPVIEWIIDSADKKKRR
jgi:glycosyltransferase involved in cell wall biosynthesis